MTTPNRPRPDRIDALLQEILTDAYGDDEQLWALLDAITGALELPLEVTLVGQAFSLVEVDYDGNVCSGITARCLGADGRVQRVTLSAIRVGADVAEHEYLAAYRRWLGGDAASED